MPRKPVDYSKTIIYKIVCNDLKVADCYVGHTTDFIKRKWNHKADCNNEKSKSYNFKIYKSIRDNGGWENWSMIEIEKYPCNDGNEARKKERYWYEELKANLNSDVPCRTHKEHYNDNKDEINKKSREYYKTHKEQIKIMDKNYYENNKDKIKERQREYNEKNRDKIVERQKEYNEKNKDKFKEYRREYYEDNKDKLLERQKVYDKNHAKQKAEYREKNKDKINEKRRERYARLKLKKNIPSSIIKENGN